jgi:hypothetical protein
MDASALTVIVSAIPATLRALATLLTSLKNSGKADTVIKKTDEIHAQTNNTMTQMRAEFQVAQQEIAGLKELVAALTMAKGVQGDQGIQGIQGQKGKNA